MVTTIQIREQTLELLRKVKDETHAASYDEAITKLITAPIQRESLAGYLGKHSRRWIMRGLRDKHDRFD